MDQNVFFPFWGALLIVLIGWAIGRGISIISKYIHNKRHTRFINKLKLQENDEGYIPVVVNYMLCDEFFRAEALSDYYIVPFPKEKEEKLHSLSFINVDLSSNNDFRDYDGKVIDALKKSEVKIIIDQDLIDKEAILVADAFIDDIEKGKLRFNKYLYAVSDVKQTKSSCVIYLYESDYFTFKVMTGLYNKLKNCLRDEQHRCSYNSLDIPNLTPFLNSIGVGGFVIIDRGYGDELVFGFRSKDSCQSGGYWHFSYDETFTHDDKKNENRMPSFEGCVLRAIDEELGISDEEQKMCGVMQNIILFDAGIIKTSGNDNRFEFEVCSFCHVSFSDNYTFGDFCLGYRYAKDSEIETQTLDFINIKKDLDVFLEKRKESGEISPEAYHLARTIKLLYDENVLSPYSWK